MRTLDLRNAGVVPARTAHRVLPVGGFFVGELVVDPGWHEA